MGGMSGGSSKSWTQNDCVTQVWTPENWKQEPQQILVCRYSLPLTAAPFTTGRWWKQPTHPPTDGQLSKLTHSYNGASFCHQKERSSHITLQHGWTLKTMPSEISQTQRQILYDPTYAGRLASQVHRDRRQKEVARGWRKYGSVL